MNIVIYMKPKEDILLEQNYVVNLKHLKKLLISLCEFEVNYLFVNYLVIYFQPKLIFYYKNDIKYF